MGNTDQSAEVQSLRADLEQCGRSLSSLLDNYRTLLDSHQKVAGLVEVMSNHWIGQDKFNRELLRQHGQIVNALRERGVPVKAEPKTLRSLIRAVLNVRV